ncbi:DUF4097 family beta strand repeat-containing protein [Alicyclobacillus fodiniaquatilis]|uniref:DUF4097 family beta strand repeat-containing protein n=1 Tax=Alicyclobacillus fodiniaquatilis TaxID=1661150 RepID=A0ABW4JNA9_9BACL
MHERRKILELVAQGKLTPEQAELLLEALQDNAPPKTDSKIAWDKATAELKTLGSQMSSVVAQSMSELRRGLETNLNNLSFREHIAASYEHEFAPTVQSLRIESQNGRIRVQQWTQPHIRIYVQADVRADEQNRAKDILTQAVQISDTDHDANIRFLDRWEGTRIHGGRIDVYMPEQIENLELETKNGSIFIDHTRADSIELDTLNGTIHIQAAHARTLRTKTQNGEIHLYDTIADFTQQLHAESKNGAIKLRGLPTFTAVHGQAKTSIGTVHVKHAGYTAYYEQEHRKNACTFKPNDDTLFSEPVTSVYLETRNGNITVQ